MEFVIGVLALGAGALLVMSIRIGAALPPGEAATYLLGLKYLEALPTLAAGKGSTIFLPAEAKGVLGAIGGIKELLRATASPGAAGGIGGVGGTSP